MVDALLAYISYEPVQRWGPISPHGVGTAVGFLAGAILMARRAEPRGIPTQEVYNAVTWAVPGAILGARGFYVLGHLEQFETLWDVIAVWQGGLTMFGGFIGGLALGLLYLRRRGFDIPHALDAAAPGFVVGVMIGRIGDMIIGDHLGERTDFFLGYRIPPGADLAPGYGPPYYVPGVVVHHTALYDFIGALVLLGAVYVYQRRRPPAGALFAFFSLWYGLQRFGIDFTRNRELIESFFFGLSGSQWAGLAFALGGAVALVKLRAAGVRPAEEPESPGPQPLEPEEAFTTSRPGEVAEAGVEHAPEAAEGPTWHAPTEPGPPRDEPGPPSEPAVPAEESPPAEEPPEPTDAIAEEIAAHQAAIPGVAAPEGEEEPETEAERTVDAPAEGMWPPEPQPDPAPAEADEPPDAGRVWPGVPEASSEADREREQDADRSQEPAAPEESRAQPSSEEPPEDGEPRAEP